MSSCHAAYVLPWVDCWVPYLGLLSMRAAPGSSSVPCLDATLLRRWACPGPVPTQHPAHRSHWLRTQVVLSKGVCEGKILFLSLIAAPEGIHTVCNKFPRVKVITSEIDEGIDESTFQVVPGAPEQAPGPRHKRLRASGSF